ncbi:MAG: mannose-1-phosphate guanylyltransferase/mannose-6-phosphate isomerase [Proteobacteria bacterium]|nr:mannose-1-phosphate guanylyltransferase/mannose-6-phosphate isomerase [Pseudomonadota bacterium]MBU1715185.1 mannose-1-phosphate guanylyltransferase/mannose-6-phosphate isomerase [Pseudomonadota bacterium]
MIVPVILAGGSGTRLWPLSRELYPKQLLPLVGEKSMLQETVNRVLPGEAISPPLIICNHSHRFIVGEQLREVGRNATIMIEPVGRNTAPAVAVAAMQAMENGDDPVLLVLPADHVISDLKIFLAVVDVGARLAEKGKLITFGVVPKGPETGYGYIRKSEAVAGMGDLAFTVERFVEKPDLATASSYVSSGDYLWNSGMFMFRASRYLEELKKFAPQIVAAASKAYVGKAPDLDFIRLDAAAFEQCPSDSIDYAVMEKTREAVVIPLDCGWSDVGSWSALWDIGAHDSDGNVLHGSVISHEVKNSYINANSRMVAAIGLEDYVIVETADVVLVAPKSRAQEVKQIVARLKTDERTEVSVHRKVYRPWGSYECVDCEERYQVKRIMVKPGARLSLQMHHHRAEHWIVVKGTARVIIGDRTLILSENQSTYIPLGEKHRLENPGTIQLELIEVQSGSYLGEDDIVRFDDKYGRKEE